MFTFEQRRAIRLAGFYLLLGAIWILLSDYAVGAFIDDPAEHLALQTYKGLAFVAVSTVFIFGLVNRELTLRRRAEQGLRFQARVLNEIGQSVITTDQDGRITFWNSAAEELFGYEADEVLGKPVLDVTPSEEERLESARIFEELQQGRKWTGEILLRRKDGSTFPAIVTNSPIFNDSGELIGVVGVTTDLSDLHEAQRELQKSEERFRALIEHTSEITTIIDTDGQVKYSSPALQRLLGRDPRERVGENIFEHTIVHPDDQAAIADAFREVRREPGMQVIVEARVQRSDGSWVLMEHEAHNMSDNPAVGGLVVHSRDISERRELEQQLFHAQKMEAIGRLAGGVAHDFNNILTSITGHAELVLSEVPESSQLHEDTVEIKRAAERAANLTRQLLAFSRRQVLQPRVLDVNQVLGDMEKMLSRLIGSDVQVESRHAPDLGHVMADRGQIEQVVLNLVVNARDAMPEGGRIIVLTENVDVEFGAGNGPAAPVPGEYVRLSVIDSGEGMDQETRKRIFEPFFTTKEVSKGTGLGLSTVYGIVEQSGGHVQVESEPSRGARFDIYLPRIEAPLTEARSTGDRDPATGSERILLVEDDPVVLRLASRVMTDAGYTVFEASDGHEAGRLAAEHEDEIDLLLTDVVMPEMDGRRVADMVLERIPGARVLFISGYSHEALAPRGVLEPGAFLLEKPFSPEQLLRKVREVLVSEGPPG